MFKEIIFGEHYWIPKGAILFSQVWTYVVNHYGNKKTSNWCDGLPLKEIFSVYQKYASCVSQHLISIFLDIETYLNHDTMWSDATNGYAQEKYPNEPFFVHIENQ